MEETKDIKPIDITAIIKKLWVHRKKYYYVLPATLVITYLFMLSFPRYYKSTVSMAPETSGTSISGSLESLASSFGLGGALGKMNTTDAIYAEIYPEVVGSKNFITELMTVDVMTQDGSVKCNYYTYMRHHQAAPWWTHIVQSIKSNSLFFFIAIDFVFVVFLMQNYKQAQLPSRKRWCGLVRIPMNTYKSAI